MSDLERELEEALSESETTSQQRTRDEAPRSEAAEAGPSSDRADSPPGVVSGPRREPGPSSSRRWGLLAALLVAMGAILALVFTSVDGAAIYSVTTDQLLSQAGDYEGRTVRVEGNLVKGSLRHRAEPCEYRFKMEKNGAALAVRYPECIVPDTFRDVPDMDVQVTAEGQLHPDGYLEASHIMAKCPSKYEMQQKAASGEQAPHSAIGTGPNAPPIVE